MNEKIYESFLWGFWQMEKNMRRESIVGYTRKKCTYSAINYLKKRYFDEEKTVYEMIRSKTETESLILMPIGTNFSHFADAN